MKRGFAGAVLVLAAVGGGTVSADPLPPIAISQGDLYRGQLPAGAHDVLLDGRPIAAAADGGFVFGAGRDAGAAAMLAWTQPDGSFVTRSVQVAPRPWRIQSLPTLPARPVPDAEFEARRPAEVAMIAAARATVTDGTGWQQAFVRPASGPVTGVFGSQRILAGTPAAPHAGVDFAAAAGSPVVAPAAGIVRLASGPFTLEGNLVMVDHGMGLVSAFLHLSRVDVQVGDVVRQGQPLGAVGRTGRATGPHLHWGLTWTSGGIDVRVDPARLLAGGTMEGRQ